MFDKIKNAKDKFEENHPFIYGSITGFVGAVAVTTAIIGTTYAVCSLGYKAGVEDGITNSNQDADLELTSEN